VPLSARNKRRTKSAQFADTTELRTLQETIARTSEDMSEPLTAAGMLVGADSMRRTFHFVTDADRDIRGTFTDAISNKKTAELPKRYTASLVKTTKLQFSTEEENVSYFLVSLSDAGPPPEPELPVEEDQSRQPERVERAEERHLRLTAEGLDKARKEQKRFFLMWYFDVATDLLFTLTGRKRFKSPPVTALVRVH
jgi:hypothetical protein